MFFCFEGFVKVVKVYYQMVNIDNDVIGQCGENVLYDEFYKEVIYDGGCCQKIFWGGKVGVQQLKQNFDCYEGDDIGNVMENGCYCCDWELYCLQIQIDRFLFFYIFYYE